MRITVALLSTSAVRPFVSPISMASGAKRVPSCPDGLPALLRGEGVGRQAVRRGGKFAGLSVMEDEGLKGDAVVRRESGEPPCCAVEAADNIGGDPSVREEAAKIELMHPLLSPSTASVFPAKLSLMHLSCSHPGKNFIAA